MKKLIFKNINELAPTGGPNGYIYNLKQGLDLIDDNEISFLDETIDKKEKIENKCVIKKLYHKFVPKLFQKFRKKKIFLNEVNNIVFYNKRKLFINLNDYDLIHFHSTFDLYSVRDELKNYNGKILLTSHSPKPAFLELLDSYKSEGINNLEKFMFLSTVDEYAFNKADYIIFPCEEAEEPYYNQWDKYKEIHEKNKEKYRYILSGIKGCSTKISKDEARKKYNIPSDAFLISYVGRHNEVKGYDLLKEIGKETLEKFSNIYFIIAGKEGPLYKLENERWIEVGWTNDPHSIIAASDLFILPNKETYFDLVFLEVLSLGIPMLVSNTGGNKYFKKFDKSGIFYFNNKEEAVSSINQILDLNEEELKGKGKLNKKIFEENFNEKIFAENYIKLINNLAKE